MEPKSLGYTTDLALLRARGSLIEHHSDHIVIRSPHNPTHWWGNFLLLAAVPTPERCQSWVDRFTEYFPGAHHLALGFDVADRSVTDLDWFADHGLRTEAAAVMTARSVTAPATVNNQAVYRQLGSDDDWRQSIELQMRCEDRGLEPSGYREFVTAASRANREIASANGGAWFGAFIRGRLAAHMGLLTAGEGLARFQAVETDPDHRREGLAGSLLHHASEFGLTELGAHTLVIVADPTYFAIDLYRSVGFIPVETQLQVERPPLA